MRLGFNGKTYRNTGSWGVPTWNLVDNIKDLALNLSKTKSDVTRRATGGWRANVGTIREATVEFGQVWNTSDDDYQTFLNSFLNGTAIDMMILDGAVGVAGSEGLRAEMEVMQFTRGEQLAEAMGCDVALEPTWSDHQPYWVTT